MFTLDLIDVSAKPFGPADLLRATLNARIDVVGVAGFRTADPSFKFANYARDMGANVLIIPSVIVPTANQGRVFVLGAVDKYVVPSGVSLEVLATGVRRCDGMTVLLTPTILEDGWTLVDASVGDRVAPVSVTVSTADTVGKTYIKCGGRKPTSYPELKVLMDTHPEDFEPCKI